MCGMLCPSRISLTLNAGYRPRLFRWRVRCDKGPRKSFRSQSRMIRLDNISKQHGHQILFIEASAALQKGEKIGLVGPNGAGKSTLFRLITGEELPDEGQVA